MSKRFWSVLILSLLGIGAAHAIDADEMRATLRSRVCKTQRVSRVEYRDRCTAVCGDVGGELYNCSPGADKFIGYASECQLKVNEENILINQYNAFVDQCRSGPSRGQRVERPRSEQPPMRARVQQPTQERRVQPSSNDRGGSLPTAQPSGGPSSDDRRKAEFDAHFPPGWCRQEARCFKFCREGNGFAFRTTC